MSWFVALFIPIVSNIKGWFAKELVSLSASAKAELQQIEAAVIVFIKSDLGKIALDSVNMAEAKLAGAAAGDKFAAARAQFIADAKTAGHDLTNIGKGIVDWMIQTAYTGIANVTAAAVAQSASPSATQGVQK